MNYDVKKLKEKLVEWVKETVGNCNVVIGISGGKDSSICAALCVEALGKDKVFGVLLPDGTQQDIDKSLELVGHLGIDFAVKNIKPATDALRNILTDDVVKLDKNGKLNDFTETNLPARVRMTALYGVASSRFGTNVRVANTCNLSEDWVGYSTKYGDSAGDFSPLANLTVHEVKELGYELGLPKDLIEKVPTDGMSGKSDEEKLGFTYNELDKYIRTGKIQNIEHKEKIDRMHKANLHKVEPMPKYETNDLEVKI